MPGPKTFQLTAVVYGLFGMAWGLQMGISGNHTMMPAHAHLNLLGWVSLSIMAAFYRFAGRTAAPRLMAANYLFSAVGPVVMVCGLYGEFSGAKGVEPVIGAGAALSMIGLGLFGLAVLKTTD